MSVTHFSWIFPVYTHMLCHFHSARGPFRRSQRRFFIQIGILNAIYERSEDSFSRTLRKQDELGRNTSRNASWRMEFFIKRNQMFRNRAYPAILFHFLPLLIQVHAFSDASEHAYAAAVFLRSCYEDGRIHVRLAASKSKVVPMTKQSIPRLELLGTLSLARLVNKFKVSTGDIHKTIYKTDSMTTLCWIKNQRVWKSFR